MATMSGGVVERENTIVENRKVLSELIRRNEFLEPSHKELCKLFTRLNADNARELVKDMKSFEPAWTSKKISDHLYGPLPGIPCGSWWGIRMDCSRDRMHDPFSASVQGGPVGAVSICTSHSNEDVDLGDMLTFTGQSCWEEEEYAGRLVGEKEQSQGSESLVLNLKNRVPVRIIRSYNLSNEYSPKTGYRYDGLYMVVDHWIGVSTQNGTRCYKFALKRLFHQEPPPWKLQTPKDRLEPDPASKLFSKNCSLLGQGRTSSRNNYPNLNSNDTIVSRCISVKRFQNRDAKMQKAVRSTPKRRPRRNETSSEPEGAQSTSSSGQGPASATTLLPVSPGRKILSTDHRNVNVSAIVTRRVSKKVANNITDRKSLPDGAANKTWKSVAGGSESQQIFSEEEEEGAKSQSTRLQNTNISIRTDLYDSSHNLKQNAKKCGFGVNHNAGIFKPRILALPRPELNFAGVDSYPGSSRTISSVKMERVESVDSRLKKRNLNHILCQEDKAASGMAETLSKDTQNLNTNADAQENQTARDPVVAESSPISGSLHEAINDSGVKNNALEGWETLKSRCLHRIEHSYASQCLSSVARKGNGRNLASPTTNRKKEAKETEQLDCGNTKDGEKTEFLVTEAAGSSGRRKPESDKMGDKSLGKSLPSTSPSQSPVFRGFRSPGRSKSGAEGSWSETSILMNSLTVEKMLDIISEEKSSPVARMLINNVIGLPTSGSPCVFNEMAKNDSRIQNLESRIKKSTLSVGTRSKEDQVAPSPRNLEISSPTNHQNLKKLNSRQLRRFENSREQKIIEIVYAGEEPDAISHTAEKQSAVVCGNSEATEEENRVFLRLRDTPDNGEKKNARISQPEDTVDFWSSKPMDGAVDKHCDRGKSAEKEQSRLTITRGRSWKRDDPPLKGGEVLESNPPFSASQPTSETPKAQIITRSKCLRNSKRGSDTNLEISVRQANVSLKRDGSTGSNQSLENPSGDRISGENVAHNSISTLGLRSMGKMQRSETKIEDKPSRSLPSGVGSRNVKNREVPKQKSPEKIRLLKRSGVRVKRKIEIANLHIDMNMSPRSQMSRVKSRSRRSLRGANHLRRRSCPAVVDRVMKRKNENPAKHPTSPLKRVKKNLQVQNSSVQIPSGVTSKKGLSLRTRTKNQASPSINNNNNNNNSVKRIGKAEKVISKIKKPMKSRARNLVVKKTTVNGLRAPAPAEIPKRREVAVARTRSGRSPRSLTVGRLGLRRSLISSTDNYARKNKMKIEKQRQKRPLSAKQQMTIQFENSNAGKPKMVSVMTQCSIISDPIREEGSEPCVYSSRNSGMDLIKNEFIEVIEIKSETIDDVANFDDEENDAEEVRVQDNASSAFNRASVRSQEHRALDKLDTREPEEVRSKICTSLQRLYKGLGVFRGQRSDSPRKGFMPYVAGNKVSALVPVRRVDGNLTLARLKSIGFKPIKPGLFTPDGFEDGTEYDRLSTSNSPRIAYSSAVVKRGVHEEYDKYTSEENNVVQYMDSRLCYEDIENEDVIFGSYAEPVSKDIFVEKMGFVEFGTELDDESDDNSFLKGSEELEEEEDFEKRDVKEWQSQLDENSSDIENAEQDAVDSDGDVPWHGWKKIISNNKETHFVGW